MSPTNIETVELMLLDVPTIRPHRLSMATMYRQTLVLARITGNDGGLGDATTIDGLTYGEESPESIKLNIDTYMRPLLVGADANQLPHACKPRPITSKGNRFAKCDIETVVRRA